MLDGAYDLGEIDRVEFSIEPNTYYALADVEAANLEVTGVPMEGNDGDLAGRIKNNGTEPVSDITIIYAVYDSEGIIVGQCYDFLDITIPPGKSAKFTISGSCGFVSDLRDLATGGDPFTYRLMISR